MKTIDEIETEKNQKNNNKKKKTNEDRKEQGGGERGEEAIDSEAVRAK